MLVLGTGYLFYIAAFFTEGVLPFMALYLLYRFCGILGMPATAALTAKLSPPRQMEMRFAISFLSQSIVSVVAPVAAAYITDAYGLFPIFTVSFIVMFLGLGVLQFGVRVKWLIPRNANQMAATKTLRTMFILLHISGSRNNCIKKHSFNASFSFA